MFTLHSSAFEPDGPIPARHTCDGDDTSPELRWSGVPAGTRSLALIVDDPDAPDPAAPRRTWVHWVRYAIPPQREGLPEGAGNAPPSDGEREALTDANAPGWHGPCPPIGRHRYYFRLLALDVPVQDLGALARRGDLEAVIAGHVLDTAVLMGTYAREARP